MNRNNRKNKNDAIVGQTRSQYDAALLPQVILLPLSGDGLAMFVFLCCCAKFGGCQRRCFQKIVDAADISSVHDFTQKLLLSQKKYFQTNCPVRETK